MKTRLIAIGIALVFLVLSTIACDSDYESPGIQRSPINTPTPSPSSTPTPSPTPTVLFIADENLQATADQITLDKYATQSAIEIAAREAEAKATAQAAALQATLTAQAMQIEQERAIATERAAQATAYAVGVKETQNAQATQHAIDVAATQAERDYQATATVAERDYRATATIAERNYRATSTAQAATAAAESTAQAIAWNQTATVESVRATEQAYYATATRQAADREITLGYARDYGIPAFLLVFIGLTVALVVYGIRQYAKRPVVIESDIRGDKPAILLKEGGATNIVDVDGQPGHVTRILPDGRVEAPQFRSAGQEERTKARDQQVDAIARPRLGPGSANSKTPEMLPMAPPPQAPAPGLRSVKMLRKLDQAGPTGLLPGPMIATLEADWQTEPGEGLDL
jgi:chemotaxis protein histidine kinase CheA